MYKGCWPCLGPGLLTKSHWENLGIFPNTIFSPENEKNNSWEIKLLKQREQGEIGNIIFGPVFPVVHLFLFFREIKYFYISISL